MTIRITGYKLVAGRLVKDEAAIEAKLDVSTRIKRRSSKKVSFVTSAKADGVKKAGQ